MKPHSDRRRARIVTALCVVAALLLVAVVLVIWRSRSTHQSSAPSSTQPKATEAPTTVPSGGTTPASTTYAVAGNEILANGVPFVPYGITVFGIANRNWQSQVTSDEAQIVATATIWHGNTVRLQVSPTDLFRSQPYDEEYLKAIKQEVSTAQARGLNVILSAQYERTGRIPMPDASTASFWKLVAPLYAHDPGVWFDLFNEPRLGHQIVPTPEEWNTWRNGGSGYVGFQTLVNEVRAVAPDNVILAEGLDLAETLAGLPGHELTGSRVIYAIHPYLSRAFATPTDWNTDWGNLSERLPVVADEWGERQGGGTCQPNAPSLVPTFLSYLAGHHIGLIAWALQSNVLIQGTNLSDPTTFAPGVPFLCNRNGRKSAATATTDDGEGAGADVLAYFAVHSRPITNS
jgi:endoglucanase